MGIERYLRDLINGVSEQKEITHGQILHSTVMIIINSPKESQNKLNPKGLLMLELKNSLTGQNHTYGIKQWKFDRDPTMFMF